ncbi:MAG: hypothetical protein HY219_00920 [Candidatus Staskawiczbacteria bacterium]|nr:hypothetical protein [Candidatus Staskawiczbacteria bacterium]
MAKKIFDILPPKTAHKVEIEIKSSETEEKKHAKSRVHKEPHHKEINHTEHHKETDSKKKRQFPLKEVLAGAGVLLLVLCGFLYFKLQKASVEIWPKTEVLNFKEQVMADGSVDAVNLSSKIIPAQYLQEKDLSQEFPSTGSASNDGKAEGTIVIYNKYSPAEAMTLKPGTHFLSDSGKYFITLQKVIVPAAKKQNNKTVPGSIEVKVQATESGEGFNIKPAKFSVPKLVGTSYYYSIYAESSQSMTGGFSGSVKKVTDDDIKTAKDVLQKKLSDNVQEALRNKIGADYILLDSAISTEITESSSAVKAGAIVGKFNYKAKAKAAALVFKKSDLESFIKEYIDSNISVSKVLLENSLTLKYSPETVDIKDKKTVVNLDFSIKTYQAIDKNDLISLFREKSVSEIKELVNNRLGNNLDQVQVKLWPFWTTKAPKDKNRIEVDLKFEQ